MRLRALGPIVATRKLTDAKGRTVRVLIGKPRRYRGGHADYYCPFQINGIDNQIRYTGGVDAVQALQLAMKAIGNRLLETGLLLRWDAGLGSDDLGFPGVEARGRPDRQLQTAVTKVFVKAFGKSVEAIRREEVLKAKEAKKVKARRRTGPSGGRA
jgi:hypothetical protein